MNKVIVNFENSTDDEIGPIADAVIIGCASTNTNFSVVTELAAVASANTTYKADLALCKHGNETNTTNKNTSKGVLVDDLRNLGNEVNIQAGGDRVKALSSKFPMAKEAEHQVMGIVEDFHVETTSIAGTFFLHVKKPTTFSTHGTTFAYWDPALGPTPADKNKWFHRHSNGISISLAGFTPGVTYFFASAYKGLDTDAPIWSAIVSKMAGD
jgi:hypothetical protein